LQFLGSRPLIPLFRLRHLFFLKLDIRIFIEYILIVGSGRGFITHTITVYRQGLIG